MKSKKGLSLRIVFWEILLKGAIAFVIFSNEASRKKSLENLALDIKSFGTVHVFSVLKLDQTLFILWHLLHVEEKKLMST